MPSGMPEVLPNEGAFRRWNLGATVSPRAAGSLSCAEHSRNEGVKMMKWEYYDRMVVFSESEEGMVSGLDSWINGAGADGWELVSSVPLIAPNKDGVAYGTIGIHMVFKRPQEAPAEA
jgi:hypothetical protein